MPLTLDGDGTISGLTHETLIASSSVTAVSTLTFSSIPQTYHAIVLRWRNGTVSGAFETYFRINGDSGGNYMTYGNSMTGGSGVAFTGNTGGTSVQTEIFGYNATNSASWQTRSQGQIRFDGYTSSTLPILINGASTYERAAVGGRGTTVFGYYFNSAAMTSITLTPASGTFTGDFFLYGVDR